MEGGTLQCKLLELNCSLLNYTGKGECENEYEDEYDLKKMTKINGNDFE